MTILVLEIMLKTKLKPKVVIGMIFLLLLVGQLSIQPVVNAEETVFPEFEYPYPLNPGEYGPPKYGGTVITSTQQEGKSLNPLPIYDTGALGPIYERMIAMDMDSGDIYPALSYKWEASSDAKTFTFHFRSNILPQIIFHILKQMLMLQDNESPYQIYILLQAVFQLWKPV